MASALAVPYSGSSPMGGWMAQKILVLNTRIPACIPITPGISKASMEMMKNQMRAAKNAG